MAGTVHVVGAGMAGLAAATSAAARGCRVVVVEMARAAGGRCRSFDDRRLGRRLDNGNHLVLSGNRAVAAYRRRIGAEHGMIELAPATFPFVDLASGDRWAVRPNSGPIPWWPWRPDRRPAGARAGGLVRDMARLALAGRSRTVAELFALDDPTFRRFWEPLAVGVLNTPPERAAARLLRPVLMETFARGERSCRPLLATSGLGDALVEPALRWLREQRADIVFGAEVEALGLGSDRVEGLRIDGAWLPLTAADRVIVATPPWTTARLVPGLAAPAAYGAILNAHFLLPTAAALQPSLLGIVGGLAQWAFCRDDVAAVTVSAAAGVVDLPSEVLAARLWPEVRTALRLPADAPLPKYRIVKERRATPEQTPATAAIRWPPQTRWSNLTLAGDWTATGLPATIEGAVRSGEQAAGLICAGHRIATQHDGGFAAQPSS